VIRGDRDTSGEHEIKIVAYTVDEWTIDDRRVIAKRKTRHAKPATRKTPSGVKFVKKALKGMLRVGPSSSGLPIPC
jgi:hypothetical protein